MSNTASQRVQRSNGRALVEVAGPGCFVGCGGQTRKGNSATTHLGNAEFSNSEQAYSTGGLELEFFEGASLW